MSMHARRLARGGLPRDRWRRVGGLTDPAFRFGSKGRLLDKSEVFELKGDEALYNVEYKRMGFDIVHICMSSC